MKYDYFVGIDPGLNGAIAIIDKDGKFVRVENLVKVIKEYATGFVKQNLSPLDLHLKLEIIKHYFSTKSLVAVEYVTSMPTDGAASAFSFGDTVGVIRAVLDCSILPYIYVPVKVWKKHFNLTNNKEESRQKALEIFPEAHQDLKLKKYTDKAEALLIARYAYETNT